MSSQSFEQPDAGCKTRPRAYYAASPGQPTVAQADQASHVTEQPTAKQFYIFGHNISHSLSPILHNAAFSHLGLPHRYSIHESEGIDESVERLMHRVDFGGASVTFPHKLHIGRLLDSHTAIAKKVGAVNTVIVRKTTGGKRQLVGDNTDWLGIKRCIESAGLGNLSSSAALVLGAGGAARAACHAVQELGIGELIIVNRTLSKADVLASNLLNVRTRTFESLGAASSTSASFKVVIACVPADHLTEEEIPRTLFSGAREGVLVEMAYRPHVTGMMKAAERQSGWKILRGVDVLEEQAYAQFELWTGTPAPCEIMRSAMKTKLSSSL